MLHAKAQLYTHACMHVHTHSGFPVTEQVRLSESPSRRIPCGGLILTVGATVERQNKYISSQCFEHHLPC